VKYTACAATGSHYYYSLEIGHLFIEIMQHSIIGVVYWTSDQKDISIFGIAHIDNAKSSYIVKAASISISQSLQLPQQGVAARVTLFLMHLI